MYLAFGIFSVFVLGSGYGSAIATQACGETLYIVDVALIDISEFRDCILQTETDPNHVLRFSLEHGGSIEDAQGFVSIYDGLEADSPVLLLENQVRHEVGLTRAESIDSIYSTGSVARLQFKEMPTSGLKLKIQKAVECPFNLGSESQCGRVVDDIACYCATFTKRGQANHTMYCKDNGMQLLSIEDSYEEERLYIAWGILDYFWTSGSHNKTSGIWTWQSTMNNFYPGYANWAPFEPNNTLSDSNCMTIKNGWYDNPCVNLYDAICELHPEDAMQSTSTLEPDTTTLEPATTTLEA